MTTQTREETARAFAAAMGWTILPLADPPTTLGMRGWVEFETRLPKLVRDNVRLPAPDAPLHEHLAFVGRVAEALGTGVQMGYCPKARAAWVGFDERVRSQEAPDPSWAAMLAAIEAKRR